MKITNSLEDEILEMSSVLGQMNDSIKNLSVDRDALTIQRDQLQGQVNSLNERFEKAVAQAEANEEIAQDAQKLAEARKVYAEDREAEVELLERSVEELESTVNVLESNVDFIKGEAERQRLQREDLEMELCALKDQMQNLRNADDDIKRFLDEKEKSLEEAHNHIQVLKSDIAGKGAEVYNPANGESIADVACMGGRETNDAISSAFDAYRSWSKTTASERSKLLRKWYDLLMAHKEELAQLITLEQGKPLKESLGEIGYGAAFIEFASEEAKRIYGDIIPAPLSDRRLFVLKQPIGVVGAITPWNFPLAMITRKVGPALACGCTVVIKPSELTPLTALAAAELSIQAGIPAGVVNVVMGNAPDIGDALIASPQVRKITFTGSTAVGKKLMAGSAETVKKVSLELGGNAPCIVFDDADLDVAVKGTLAAKFRNSGQTCVCANRILVQEGIYDKFANALLDAVQSMKVGDGFSEGVAQGPLINEAAVKKVESLIHDAKSKGAKVILGGKRHSLGSTFYEPTVITDVDNEMDISRQEAFGPVAPLLRFKTEEDAIRIANDTNAGLGSYVFTNSIPRSWRVAEALEYGLVGINEGVISTEVAPFGGVKQSGLGREGSKYGMDEYLEIKYVCLGNMNKD